jgi:hypothetical protein
VCEASNRRIDAAETLYKTLEIHFKRQKPADKPETEKEFLRAAKAYFRSTKRQTAYTKLLTNNSKTPPVSKKTWKARLASNREQ